MARRSRHRYTVTMARPVGPDLEVQQTAASPGIAAQMALRLHPRATVVRVEKGWARPGGSARSHTHPLRLDPAELERYRRAADAEGLSLSEWLRRAAEARLAEGA